MANIRRSGERARLSGGARLTFFRYGVFSVFLRSVPPPSVHIHLHLYTDLSSAGIPSLSSETGLASPDEARAFELWLRKVWADKEKRMEGFFRNGAFESGEGGRDAKEVVSIRQL